MPVEAARMYTTFKFQTIKLRLDNVMTFLKSLKLKFKLSPKVYFCGKRSSILKTGQTL